MPLKYLVVSFVLMSTCTTFAQNTLSNPPYTVDDLIQFEGATQLLQGANAQQIVPTADNAGITLASGATAGSITLRPIQTRFPFNEALPSWNGQSGPNAGFRVWMAVASASPQWFEAGTWGTLGDEPTTRIAPLQDGVYNIDTLILNRLAQGILVRIDLIRATAADAAPQFRLFSLSYTNSTGDQNLYSKFGRPATNAPLQPASIEVPYRSQVVANKPWIGRICSPCSVAMTLAAYGISQDTQKLAGELYDRVSDAFGVWHRSIQGAAQYGVRGYVHRFRNWQDVQRELVQKHVICASIRFQPGEVQDPLAVHGKRKQGTLGHLVLLRGITPEGQIIVHDTNSKDFGPSSLWQPAELAKAWFDKGGVAYVFTGRKSSRSQSR